MFSPVYDQQKSMEGRSVFFFSLLPARQKGFLFFIVIFAFYKNKKTYKQDTL